MNDRQSLTQDQLDALSAWRECHGHFWRARLLDAWEHAAYKGVSADHAAALQGLRNTLGPRWLVAYRGR